MLKIAILGPESTGKTILAGQLAEHFKSLWVPEYARDYVENLKGPYTYNDICIIALKQIEEEQEAEKNPSSAEYIFFDTELIITKVWFSYCFGKVPDFLTEQLKTGFLIYTYFVRPIYHGYPIRFANMAKIVSIFLIGIKRRLNKPESLMLLLMD